LTAADGMGDGSRPIPNAHCAQVQFALTVPTIYDRVCQQALLNRLEPIFEPVFDEANFGYRRGRSTKDALRKVWKEIQSGSEWIVDADLKDFFGSVDHEKLLTLVAQQVADSRVLRLIQAMLKAGSYGKGRLFPSERGTPQGGVVSPILANIFLHYAFDLWMVRTHPDLPWCRYADDGLEHCHNEQEAQALKAELQTRLAECRLEMHPTKTKIVYCKDTKRKGVYPNVKFDFLGYCFRPRLVRRFRDKTLFCGFNPAVSPSAMKAMRSAIRELKLRHQTQLSLEDIARRLDPLLRGWIEYYGCYAPSALYPLLRHVNQMLVAWVMRKFKRFTDHKIQASQFLQRLAAERPISSYTGALV